jgi:hypothetical protein
VVAGSESEAEGRLSRLLRAGIVRPRRSAPPQAIFRSQPPRTKNRASIVEMLIAERREGR